MPSSIARRTIRRLSCSSTCGRPRCQPPSPMADSPARASGMRIACAALHSRGHSAGGAVRAICSGPRHPPECNERSTEARGCRPARRAGLAERSRSRWRAMAPTLLVPVPVQSSIRSPSCAGNARRSKETGRQIAAMAVADELICDQRDWPHQRAAARRRNSRHRHTVRHAAPRISVCSMDDAH